MDLVKIAEIAGYSEKINSAKNVLILKANIEGINLELSSTMSERDSNLVVSLIKHIDNLTNKEKDIIEFIISHKEINFKT